MTFVISAEPWDFEITPERTALLVIDMQNDFCRAGGYAYQCLERKGLGAAAITSLRGPIEPLKRVIEAARKASLTVIYTVESHWADLSNVPPNKMEGTIRAGAPIGANGPYGRHLIRGNWGTEVIEELEPLPNEHVVHKAGKNAFVATDLDLILRAKGVTHLAVTGVTTDCCVLFTRQGARDRGYYTVQIEDCCAASYHENHEAIFNMIRAHPEAFGLMTSSDMFIRGLRGSS